MKSVTRRTAMGVIAGSFAAGHAWAKGVPALDGLTKQQADEMGTLIEGAVKEGSVSYWDTVIQPGTNDVLAVAFREYYGLPSSFQVNYTLSFTSNLVTRVEQELTANNVSIDVASIASPPWTFERAKAGDIVEYHSPQYVHYKRIFDAGLGMDGYFAFNGGYFFVPMWNADNLDFDGTSYEDVIGAVEQGRISCGGAVKSSSYLATYIGQKQVLPEQFFEKLAAMKPAFIVRSEQVASGLVSGEYTMAYSGMPTRAYQYNQKGANLKFMIPKEGVVLMPQSTFILRDSPHPNAAKLWMNFILSDEAQTILAKHEALISGRTGFKSPLPEYSPNIERLELIKVDWSSMSTDVWNKARQEWENIFNP